MNRMENRELRILGNRMTSEPSVSDVSELSFNEIQNHLKVFDQIAQITPIARSPKSRSVFMIDAHCLREFAVAVAEVVDRSGRKGTAYCWNNGEIAFSW